MLRLEHEQSIAQRPAERLALQVQGHQPQVYSVLRSNEEQVAVGIRITRLVRCNTAIRPLMCDVPMLTEPANKIRGSRDSCQVKVSHFQDYPGTELSDGGFRSPEHMHLR